MSGPIYEIHAAITLGEIETRTAEIIDPADRLGYLRAVYSGLTKLGKRIADEANYAPEEELNG